MKNFCCGKRTSCFFPILFPVETGRKLNVLCTFNLRRVSTRFSCSTVADAAVLPLIFHQMYDLQNYKKRSRSFKIAIAIMVLQVNIMLYFRREH